MRVTEQLQLVRKKVEEVVLNVGGPLLHRTPHGAGGDGKHVGREHPSKATPASAIPEPAVQNVISNIPL